MHFLLDDGSMFYLSHMIVLAMVVLKTVEIAVPVVPVAVVVGLVVLLPSKVAVDIAVVVLQVGKVAVGIAVIAWVEVLHLSVCHILDKTLS
jgi:hypothetical protein